MHVLELPDEGATGNVRLLRSFAQHRARGAARALAGRVAAHEASANGRTQSQSDEEDEQESESSQNAKREVYTQIVCATVSPDGQWLVTVDLSRRVHVFNLDALQVSRPISTNSS